MPTKLCGFLAAALACAPTVLSAQTPDVLAEIRQLRAELDRTRAEMQELRTQVDRLSGTRDPNRAESGPPLASVVEMLQAQVAEQAQTKVESSSRLPVRLFGAIHSTTAWNSGEANWLESPNIVGPTPEGPTGSWTATMRQSRIGVRAEGLTLGRWQASGSAVFDFFGGTPAFQTGTAMGLPRLLYAYSRFERGATAFEVGQDDMILAPRNPTSLSSYSFPGLYRSGNLYLRVPQARVEMRIAEGGFGELRATAGIVAPLAGDYSGPYVFAPPALSGERSNGPAWQGRVGWQIGTGDRGASAGVSGHYGNENLAAASRTSWATALDVNAQNERFGVTGEFFVGDNMAQFGGALGQFARTHGGFLEGRYRPHRQWETVVGGGTDRPDRGAAVALSSNNSLYGNVIFRVTPEVATSVEYRWLETTAGGLARENHHVDWSLVYSF